jgi:DNA-binding MarR family transcriptional regulator
LSSQVLSTQGTEIVAFARLMRAHALLRRTLASEVLSPRGLTVNDFEALVHLSHEADRRLRRVDLAERLTLSASGVTRMLDGLEASGLVRKQHCPDDARVTWAVLTDEGARTLECVGAEHARALRELFADALDDDEMTQLTHLLGRLPGVDAGSCVS